jgi:hypothetical protein
MSVLGEAGVKVTAANKKQLDRAVHPDTLALILVIKARREV